MRLQRIPALHPAERHLLALLAAPPAAPPAPPAPAPPGFWRGFLELARVHNLRGHLYARLHDAAGWDELPDAVRRELRQGYVQNGFRDRLFRRELRRVLEELAAEGIVPVLLKGTALNLTVYADPGERAYADIDLLLGLAELDRAAAVMRGLGYVLDQRYQSEAFYRRFHFHLIFRHARRPWCCFELHWDLSLPVMDTDLAAPAVRERALPVTVDGRPARLPQPEDLLLHLCQHTALSAFSVLAQLRDVHAVATHPAWELDPEAFWHRARRGRLLHIAGACLALAGWFGHGPALDRLRGAGPPWRGALRRLLRPETVLRRRLLQSSAGLRAAALVRRDRPADRRAYLGRLVRPSAVDLGLDGHPERISEFSVRRRFSRRGLTMAARALVYLLLARCGWEVEPLPRPRAASADAGRPERA